MARKKSIQDLVAQANRLLSQTSDKNRRKKIVSAVSRYVDNIENSKSFQRAKSTAMNKSLRERRLTGREYDPNVYLPLMKKQESVKYSQSTYMGRATT